MLPSNFAASGLPIKVSKAGLDSCEGLSVDAWAERSARALPSPLVAAFAAFARDGSHVEICTGNLRGTLISPETLWHSIRLGLRVVYCKARGMLSLRRCTPGHTELGWMEFHGC
jgi:hypothetical protein